jgi:hypothetical protein
MRDSKQLALTFLLGAVLVGGVMGFTVDRIMVRDDLCPRWGDQRSMRARLADDLGLTPAQRAAVDTILDRRQGRYEALMKPIRPQMDMARDTARAQIRRVLDPSQQAKWDGILREIAEADARKGSRR